MHKPTDTEEMINIDETNLVVEGTSDKPDANERELMKIEPNETENDSSGDLDYTNNVCAISKLALKAKEDNNTLVYKQMS